MNQSSLTPFGRLVRKLRIDESMLLKEMASHLSVSPSLLSSVEMGRKNIPSGMVEKVASIFNLPERKLKELQEAAEESKTAYKMQNVNPERRDVAAALARRINELSPEEVENIRDVLNRRKA